jgi:hypothetical protein
MVFDWQAQVYTLSFGDGSATLNYWGTFTPTIDYYDANGNIIGTYDFPSPPPTTAPEPSTIALLGSTMAGLAAWGLLRRFRRPIMAVNCQAQQFSI